MNSTTIAKGIIKAISLFLLVGISLYVLYQLRFLLIYVSVAAVLALLGRPLVQFLSERFRIGTTFGAVITVILYLGVMAGLIAMFIPMLTEQGKNLALFNFDNIEVELDKVLRQISEYFGTSKEAVEDAVKEGAIENEKTAEDDTEVVPSILETVVDILTQFSIGLLSVIFMVFFMLKDRNSFQLFFLAMIAPAHRERTISSIDKINSLLSRYFLGLALQIFTLFIIYAITLVMVGTENALVVAFFCALFNILPYIGPFIGAVLMALLTITSHNDMNFSQEVLPLVGYVMIGVTIGQLVDNFVSQPFIYSSSIKSHPMEIFIIIIAAGLLFGIVGMMVAVPAYAVSKVVLREFFQDNRFVRAWTKGI